MKMFLLLTVCFCLSAISVAGQQSLPPNPDPHLFPDKWKEYTYPEDNIRFRFPVEPTLTKDPKDAGRTHTYTRQSFMLFRLTVSDIALNLGIGNRRDNFVSSYLAMVEIAIQGSGGKLIKSEISKVDGNPGKFYEYETKDGKINRTKVFVIDDKLYIAEAEVKKGLQIGINWENDFEKPAMAFLNSIHAIGL